MKMENTRLKNFQENSTDSCESNYRELNSQQFMRIVNIADYFGGMLGYNMNIINAHFNAIKWKFLGFPLLSNLLIAPFVWVKFFDEFNKDIYQALRVIPNIVSTYTTFLQRFRMFYLERELKELYANMFELWDKELRNGIHPDIVKNARKHLSFSKLYSGVLISVMFVYISRPFSTLFTYYVLNGNVTFLETNMFPLKYTFAIDTVWKWVLCNFWEASSVINTVMIFISNDLAFVQICALLSLQIQVVGNKLQTIVRKNDKEDDDSLLVKRLLSIGTQHCQLIRLCRRIEHAFNPGLLAIMIAASITLCTCAIGVEKEISRNGFAAAAISLFHFSGAMLQTTVYCNTAENISYQFENLSEKIYDSQWFGHSKRFQKMTILIMLRSQIPYKFKTYGLYNVDRLQLTKIILLAYNLLMALRNMRAFKGE